MVLVETGVLLSLSEGGGGVWLRALSSSTAATWVLLLEPERLKLLTSTVERLRGRRVLVPDAALGEANSTVDPALARLLLRRITLLACLSPSVGFAPCWDPGRELTRDTLRLVGLFTAIARCRRQDREGDN